MRSLHRYAADGLVLVMLLHLARELLYGRYHSFRWYSWITGVPVLWLVYASGIGGYWLVWDQLGLFSAMASAEWFDWLPIFSDPATRNFQPGILNDRFFSLLVFLHIGIPLFLLLALWVHIQRVSQSDVSPRVRWRSARSSCCWCSRSPSRPSRTARPTFPSCRTVLHIDWYYLFIHPLMYLTSPAGLWAIAGLFTLLLLALPLLPHPKQAPIAVVNPPNCNGCRRCFVDCPYGAIAMLPHPDKPGHELAGYCPTCAPPAASVPAPAPLPPLSAAWTSWSPASTCRSSRSASCARRWSARSPPSPASRGSPSSAATAPPTRSNWKAPTPRC
jgi:ferredoxin